METNQSIASKSGTATTTLQTSQPAGGGNLGTAQHWAETAIIGERTRRLLVVWGKLNDAANEYVDLINEVYGIQTDSMVDGFFDNFSKVSDEVLGMIPAFIIESREETSDSQAII